MSAEGAQRLLKDLMFSAWREGTDAYSGAGGVEEETAAVDSGAGGEGNMCREGRADTQKMLALIDFYLPFLPLERRHIERCVQLAADAREAVVLACTAACKLLRPLALSQAQSLISC